MTPRIVDCRIKMSLKPHQRARVAGRRIFLYQPLNERACRLYFALEFVALCVERRANGGHGSIRWRSQLPDHEPPQLKRTLYRADIGSRQIAIGGNIDSGKIV